MVYVKVLDVSQLGIMCNFCGYAYFFLKLLRKTCAAAFKACFARILDNLPWSRYCIVILDFLTLLLLLFTEYI